MSHEPNHRAGQQILLATLACAAALVGVWASIAPMSFYDDFVFGRQWVALDGPFDEHLIRDVGGLNLALAVVTAAATRWPEPRIVATVAVATLAYAIPHLAYHATAMDPFGPGDVAAQLATLTAQIGAPALLLWELRAGRDRRPVQEDSRSATAR